jgi:ribose 5-phosphate isomerase A
LSEVGYTIQHDQDGQQGMVKMTKDEMKKIAGEKAVEFIQDGMNIGLGTGSTVYWAIQKLGERIQEGLRIQAIPTSKNTARLAKEQGIPLTTFQDIRRLDLTIDGADEINPELELIKGGGGALLREKLVAVQSQKLIIIADESKFVPTLGAFPLPIEVVPFAYECTAERIKAFGCQPELRMDNKQPFITDNGNYILDCHFKSITQPEELQRDLKLLEGVIEVGLFIGLASRVILGGQQGIRILQK